MALDIDEIAEDAVDEVFGFRGRAGPVRRAVRRTVARRAAARDYNRGGWGSPGWQAAQAGGYSSDLGGFEEAPYLEEEEPEDEILEDEEEYGLLFDEDDDGDDEFGRRGGGGGRHPVRRAVRRAVHRNVRRRRNRQSSQQQSMDAGRSPLQFDGGSEEEPLPYEDEEELEDGAFMSTARFGEDYGPPMVVRTPQQTTFRSALDTGVGFGLGFLGVALGINILAAAFSGRR